MTIGSAQRRATSTPAKSAWNRKQDALLKGIEATEFLGFRNVARFLCAGSTSTTGGELPYRTQTRAAGKQCSLAWADRWGGRFPGFRSLQFSVFHQRGHGRTLLGVWGTDRRGKSGGGVSGWSIVQLDA